MWSSSRVFAFVALASLVQLVTAGPFRPATVIDPVANATIVNVYWDVDWDRHHPNMKRAKIDALTQAVVNSSYFGGLGEYGVQGTVFGGGMLPPGGCASRPTDHISLVDPLSPSISDFIGCLRDHGGALLHRDPVLINIIFPQSSIEKDISGQLCTPSNNGGIISAWHFHGTYSALGPFKGQPLWTAIMTQPSCNPNGSIDEKFVLGSILHEDVEALTDPVPVNLWPARLVLSSEIADLCEGQFSAPIFMDQKGGAILSESIPLPQWMSNSRQRCVDLIDSSQPSIGSVSFTGWGSDSRFSVAGSALGSSTPQRSLPFLSVSGPNWRAGNSLAGEGAISPATWSPTSIQDASFDAGGRNNKPNAPLQVSVCNPQSLKCATVEAVSAPGPYTPRLRVTDQTVGSFPAGGSVSVKLGAATLMSYPLDANCYSCSDQVMVDAPIGTAPLVQTVVSGKAAVKVRQNSCGASLTLNEGDERWCIFVNEGPPPPKDPPDGDPKCGRHCRPKDF